MTDRKTNTVIAVLALVALGAAYYQLSAARKARSELAATTERVENLRAQLTTLQKHLTEAEQRVEAAARDRAAVFKAVQAAAAAHTATNADKATPITSAAVLARYKQAQALAKDGQYEAALKEFLWCYDIGMKQAANLNAVRLSGLVIDIGKLGALYPEALAALRDRRERAESRTLASENDFDAASEFAALNRTLGDNERNMELYDQLPEGDRRRRTLASNAYDSFVTAQRYDAALEGRPYGSMSSLFEVMTRERPEIASMPNADAIRKSMHDTVVKTTVTNVEVLAGAGDLAHAQALTARLLAYDGSEATKTLLQQHAARAGHPELLTPPANP
jgi:hypothetical protein